MVLRRLVLSACLVAVAGCGVPPSAPSRAPVDDLAAVPNLRRASSALQTQIQRAQDNVSGLRRKLSGARIQEEAAYDDFVEAELDYAIRAADLEGVLLDLDDLSLELEGIKGDVAAADAEIVGLKARRDQQRAEIAALRAEIEALEGEQAATEAAAAVVVPEAAEEVAGEPVPGDGSGG